MADDDWMDQVKAAWTAQTVEVPRLDPEALRARNSALERSLRWRNLRELAAAAFVVVGFGTSAWFIEDLLFRVGCLMILVAAAVVVFTLVRRGTPDPVPFAEQHLAWRIRTLRQQRDLLASVWWWYLGPLVPGMTVILVAMSRDSPPALIGAYAAFCAATFAGVGWLNHVAARRIDRELKELEDA